MRERKADICLCRTDTTQIEIAGNRWELEHVI